MALNQLSDRKILNANPATNEDGGGLRLVGLPRSCLVADRRYLN